MKRLVLLLCALLLPACDDDGPVHHRSSDAGAPDAAMEEGVCDLSKCPEPDAGIACCTPDAHCGNDPTGLGLTCQPNERVPSTRKCVLRDCPTPLVGNACCTPTARCGWDPFASGLICLPNASVNVPADAGVPPLCDLASCPAPDAGPAPCCLLDGQCGVDRLGTGQCLPAPTCDLSKCPPPVEGGPAPCCLTNGECGIDTFGIGICFPPPQPLCDLAACPMVDGGAKACCLQNGQCGVDTLGIGICSAPPSKMCDLAKCPKSAAGVAACCMPNGDCGFDSLGIGVCYAAPPTSADGGTTPVSGPPDDPSITGECPSFIGMYGPVWGCCSAYGVCGTFASNQCLLPAGTELPIGPPPSKDSGVTEPFLRCTPPATLR